MEFEIGQKVAVINKGLIGSVVGFETVKDQFNCPFEKPMVHITLKVGNKKQREKPTVLDYISSFNPSCLAIKL